LNHRGFDTYHRFLDYFPFNYQSAAVIRRLLYSAGDMFDFVNSERISLGQLSVHF